MDRLCPVCAAEAVEGFAFCGSCGARFDAGHEDRVEPGAEPGFPADASTPVVADPVPAVPPAAQVDRPIVPGRSPRRALLAMGAMLALVALVAGVLRPGDDDGPVATVQAEPGGGRFFPVTLPELTGQIAWQQQGALPTDRLGPFPWAAPVPTEQDVVVVVPGGVAFVPRAVDQPGRGTVVVPTSARSGPAVLDPRASRVVVVASGSAWAVSPGRVLARSDLDGIADVTPVAISGTQVLVEGSLGSLFRLRLDGDAMVEDGALGGLDVADGQQVSRFRLGVHAVDEDGAWVGAQERGTGTWTLVRIDLATFTVVAKIDLGARTPTLLGVGEGRVVVAADDVVRLHDSSGQPVWEVTTGAGAQVLGQDDERILVRHDQGRTVLGLQDGREIGRASTGLVQGARSVAAAGEVLVLDRESQLVALRVRDATVGRRLDGRSLSVGGQDGGLIAWVVVSATSSPMLRLQPAPDREPLPPAESDARDVPLEMPGACQVAPFGDHVAWHDGEQLRELDLQTGRVVASVAASSSAESVIAVRDGDREVLVVDQRGVVRVHGPRLDPREFLAIGDDPLPGVAVAGDLVVAAGGTEGQATLSTTDGYLRGVGPDGASRWLLRTRESISTPPVARGPQAAARQTDGNVILVADGILVHEVVAASRSLDAPALDARGAVLRDGDDVVAVFPQGEEAWRAIGVGTAPGVSTDGGVVVVRQRGDVVGLDRATGVERWRRASLGGPGVASAPVASPVIADEQVVVSLAESIVVLDLMTGMVVGRVEVGSPLMGEVLPTPAGVLACTTGGQLLLLT